ncbi:MAG: hypothetical protein J5563_02820 [Clostridia bacterium]|nr:hypothetical protein [Clostridia bacterium]
MTENRNKSRLIQTIVLFVFCIFTMRYYISVFYNTLKMAGSEIQLTDAGYSLVFQNDLFMKALPLFLPSIIPYLAIVIFISLLCICEWRNGLGKRKGTCFCSVICSCSLILIIFFWLSDKNYFTTDANASVLYSRLELACFKEALFYNPFGILGGKHVELVFLTRTGCYTLVKYLFPTVSLIASLLLTAVYLGSGHKDNIKVKNDEIRI